MIRLVLADDQELVRAGLRMILEAEPDVAVVGEAADGETAVSVALSLRPDVVLMDVRMPVVDGLEAATRLLAADPSQRVVMLTTFDHDDYVQRALAAGAVGFLLKSMPPARLVDGVRLALTGEALLAPSITRRIVEDWLSRSPAPPPDPARLAPLTARERDVLTQIGLGRSNGEIKDLLVLSEATVKTHVNRIFAKLGVRDRVQAVVVACECGLVRPGASGGSARGLPRPPCGEERS